MSTNLQPSLLQNVTPLPSRPQLGVCAHCHQKLPRTFKHVLGKGLVSILWKLYHAGQPIRLAELSLTSSEFTNAQKLGYFRLAQSLDGKWSITERGLLFLGNHIEVEKFVLTRSGKVVDREGAIKVGDVDERWWEKIDYARESKRA